MEAAREEKREVVSVQLIYYIWEVYNEITTIKEASYLILFYVLPITRSTIHDPRLGPKIEPSRRTASTLGTLYIYHFYTLCIFSPSKISYVDDIVATSGCTSKLDR